jgi:hypothetical protein
MDFSKDERIKRVHEQIQQEKDCDKLLELARELVRLLDGGKGGKPPDSKG